MEEVEIGTIIAIITQTIVMVILMEEGEVEIVATVVVRIIQRRQGFMVVEVVVGIIEEEEVEEIIEVDEALVDLQHHHGMQIII